MQNFNKNRNGGSLSEWNVRNVNEFTLNYIPGDFNTLLLYSHQLMWTYVLHVARFCDYCETQWICNYAISWWKFGKISNLKIPQV